MKLLHVQPASEINCPDSRECVSWESRWKRIGLLELLIQEHALLIVVLVMLAALVACCFALSLWTCPPPALNTGERVVSSSPRSIGTATLNALLHVHLPPITGLSTRDLTRLTL